MRLIFSGELLAPLGTFRPRRVIAKSRQPTPSSPSPSSLCPPHVSYCHAIKKRKYQFHQRKNKSSIAGPFPPGNAPREAPPSQNPRENPPSLDQVGPPHNIHLRFRIEVGKLATYTHTVLITPTGASSQSVPGRSPRLVLGNQALPEAEQPVRLRVHHQALDPREEGQGRVGAPPPPHQVEAAG